MTGTCNGVGTHLSGSRKLTDAELNKWSKHFPYIPHHSVHDYLIATVSFVFLFIPLIPLETVVFYYTKTGSFNSQYVILYYPVGKRHVYWEHIKKSWVFYIAPFIGVIVLGFFTFGSISSLIANEPNTHSNDNILKEAQPYISQINTRDSELREKATKIVSYCSGIDKTCYVNEIYRNVIESLKYYSEPLRKESVQSPNETLYKGGGNSGDLIVLINSYLENLGVETYFILNDGVAYSLACGVNMQDVLNYAKQSQISRASKNQTIGYKGGDAYVTTHKKESFTLERGYGIFYNNFSTNQSNLGDTIYSPILSRDIEYFINSSEPVNIYFMPSIMDFDRSSYNEVFNEYTECRRNGITIANGSCYNLSIGGGMVLHNRMYYLENLNKNYDATITLELTIHSRMSVYAFLRNISINPYTIEGDQCIVLDVTARKDGYIGYDANLTGTKIAINSATQKYYDLTIEKLK